MNWILKKDIIFDVKRDFEKDSKMFCWNLKFFLNDLGYITDIDLNRIKFKKNIQMTTDSGQNKVAAMETFREGEILISELSENKMKVCYDINLHFLRIMSFLIGTGIVLFVWTMASVSLALSIFVGSLALLIVHTIGYFYCNDKMYDIIIRSIEMNYLIDKIEKNEYQEVVDVWEASVRATHDFLKEEDIEYFKPLILNQYLDAVELRCIRNEEQKIIGFIGVAEGNVEMLFVYPDMIGKGVGGVLLRYAIDELNVAKVDVNEDNKQAIGFYKRYDFEIYNRSELDSTGKPYPILHMKLMK